MKKKIKIEKGFIETTENLILRLLREHNSNSNCKLDAFTKAKMKELIKSL